MDTVETGRHLFNTLSSSQTSLIHFWRLLESFCIWIMVGCSRSLRLWLWYLNFSEDSNTSSYHRSHWLQLLTSVSAVTYKTIHHATISCCWSSLHLCIQCEWCSYFYSSTGSSYLNSKSTYRLNSDSHISSLQSQVWSIHQMVFH